MSVQVSCKWQRTVTGTAEQHRASRETKATHVSCPPPLFPLTSLCLSTSVLLLDLVLATACKAGSIHVRYHQAAPGPAAPISSSSN